MHNILVEDELETQIKSVISSSANSKVSLVDVPKTVARGLNSVDERLEFSLKYAKSQATACKKNMVVCVYGSLFAAAEARETLARIDPALFGISDWVHEMENIS